MANTNIPDFSLSSTKSNQLTRVAETFFSRSTKPLELHTEMVVDKSGFTLYLTKEYTDFITGHPTTLVQPLMLLKNVMPHVWLSFLHPSNAGKTLDLESLLTRGCESIPILVEDVSCRQGLLYVTNVVFEVLQEVHDLYGLHKKIHLPSYSYTSLAADNEIVTYAKSVGAQDRVRQIRTLSQYIAGLPGVQEHIKSEGRAEGGNLERVLDMLRQCVTTLFRPDWQLSDLRQGVQQISRDVESMLQVMKDVLRGYYELCCLAETGSPVKQGGFPPLLLSVCRRGWKNCLEDTKRLLDVYTPGASESLVLDGSVSLPQQVNTFFDLRVGGLLLDLWRSVESQDALDWTCLSRHLSKVLAAVRTFEDVMPFAIMLRQTLAGKTLAKLHKAFPVVNVNSSVEEVNGVLEALRTRLEVPTLASLEEAYTEWVRVEATKAVVHVFSLEETYQTFRSLYDQHHPGVYHAGRLTFCVYYLQAEARQILGLPVTYHAEWEFYREPSETVLVAPLTWVSPPLPDTTLVEVVVACKDLILAYSGKAQIPPAHLPRLARMLCHNEAPTKGTALYKALQERIGECVSIEQGTDIFTSASL